MYVTISRAMPPLELGVVNGESKISFIRGTPSTELRIAEEGENPKDNCIKVIKNNEWNATIVLETPDGHKHGEDLKVNLYYTGFGKDYEEEFYLPPEGEKIITGVDLELILMHGELTVPTV